MNKNKPDILWIIKKMRILFTVDMTLATPVLCCVAFNTNIVKIGVLS